MLWTMVGTAFDQIMTCNQLGSPFSGVITLKKSLQACRSHMENGSEWSDIDLSFWSDEML